MYPACPRLYHSIRIESVNVSWLFQSLPRAQSSSPHLCLVRESSLSWLNPVLQWLPTSSAHPVCSKAITHQSAWGLVNHGSGTVPLHGSSAVWACHFVTFWQKQRVTASLFMYIGTHREIPVGRFLSLICLCPSNFKRAMLPVSYFKRALSPVSNFAHVEAQCKPWICRPCAGLFTCYSVYVIVLTFDIFHFYHLQIC